MLGVRPVRFLVNVPTPNVPDSVVVAVSPPERDEFVPQAKPRMVEEALPSEVMFPFNVTVDVEAGEAAAVETVGAETPVTTCKYCVEVEPGTRAVTTPSP